MQNPHLQSDFPAHALRKRLRKSFVSESFGFSNSSFGGLSSTITPFAMKITRLETSRANAIADPYAMQPQSIMEDQESRRELYDGLKRLTQREQTYLLYRYGFTDGKEHPLIGTAIYFHLTKGRAQKTEEQAMDNLWLELPWWFI